MESNVGKIVSKSPTPEIARGVIVFCSISVLLTVVPLATIVGYDFLDFKCIGRYEKAGT
jgi:hypothetical protein